MAALNDFSDELWAQPSIHKIISKAMARPDAATFKFDYTMVESNRQLWDWAAYAIDEYRGTFELMVEFRTKARLRKQMSPKQCAVALNTLLRCWKNSLEEIKKLQAAQAKIDAPVDFSTIPDMMSPGKAALLKDLDSGHNGADLRVAAWEERKPTTTIPAVQVKRPTDGIYTYVTADGDYRVIRFLTTKLSSGKETTFVSYQYGPDNENGFAKCGKIDHDGQLVIWAKGYLKEQKEVKHTPAQRADLVEAIVFICMLDKDQLLKSGEAYALRSGRCFICGRPLTVPSSISAGIGPVCEKKWR